MVWRRVDFPLPFGPSNAMVSLLENSIDNPFRISLSFTLTYYDYATEGYNDYGFVKTEVVADFTDNTNFYNKDKSLIEWKNLNPAVINIAIKPEWKKAMDWKSFCNGYLR